MFAPSVVHGPGVSTVLLVLCSFQHPIRDLYAFILLFLKKNENRTSEMVSNTNQVENNELFECTSLTNRKFARTRLGRRTRRAWGAGRGQSADCRWGMETLSCRLGASVYFSTWWVTKLLETDDGILRYPAA